MDVAVHWPRPRDVVVATAAARCGGDGRGGSAARRCQEVQAAVVDFDKFCQLGVDVEDGTCCCCCFCGGLDLADVWELWSAVRHLCCWASFPPDYRSSLLTCLDLGQIHASLAERATAGQHRRWLVCSDLLHLCMCMCPGSTHVGSSRSSAFFLEHRLLELV